MASSPEINRWNEQWRADPRYRQILAKYGINPDYPIHATDKQRKQIQAEVEQVFGFKFKDGVELDPSLNMNENEGFSKYAKDWKTYAAIGGGMTGLGLAGLGPLGFLGGSGAASAAGAGGAGASGSGGTLAASSIPGLHAAVPASIASQGVSASVPLAASGTLASSSIPGLEAAVPAGIASQGVSQTLGTSAPSIVKAVESAGSSALGKAAEDAGGGILKKILPPENGAALAALIAGLAGSRNNGEPSAETQRIQAINEAQMRRADPLHQVATNLAFGRMPLNYRQGVTLKNVPLPEQRQWLM